LKKNGDLYGNQIVSYETELSTRIACIFGTIVVEMTSDVDLSIRTRMFSIPPLLKHEVPKLQGDVVETIINLARPM
jgi:hypothetical protein